MIRVPVFPRAIFLKCYLRKLTVNTVIREGIYYSAQAQSGFRFNTKICSTCSEPALFITSRLLYFIYEFIIQKISKSTRPSSNYGHSLNLMTMKLQP